MIGVHPMFFSSKAAEPRAFLRDTHAVGDLGYGLVTRFGVPGKDTVQPTQDRVRA
ncbi:MAG: hypothetical protein ABI585_11395 [Betaproteobacteria bacterium]